MALKNFTQFTPQTVLSATDYVVGYRDLDEIRTDLDSLTVAISGLLISKGFTPGGGGLGSVRRISYRYTIDAGENLNAVSGTDDFSRLLSYTPGQIEVYRNGSHLVETLDFTASNGTQVTNMSSFNVGDIIEVVALSATGLFVVASLTGDGAIFQKDFRYSVGPTGSIANGALTITGPDDFGATLTYVTPNLAVYLNGSRLVNSYDYTATDGTNISLNEPVITGDIVDVQTLSSIGTGAIFGVSAFAGVSRIVAQNGVKTNTTIGTGLVTISADIQGLTSKANPASNDQIMIFDVAGNTNKKTTIASLTALSTTTTSNTAQWQRQTAQNLNGFLVSSGVALSGIPSWVKKITVTLYNASFTGGPGSFVLQLGSGAGPTFVTSGYDSRASTTITGGEPGGNEIVYSTSTSGLQLTEDSTDAGNTTSGNWTLVNISGNIWVLNGSAEAGSAIDHSVGSIDVGATLTAIRLVAIGTFGGSATFDSGSINYIFEG